MQSLAIIKSLPQEWKDQLRTGKAKTAEKASVLVELQKTNRSSHWAYNKLLTKVEEPEKAKRKWEMELGVKQNSWSQIFSRMYRSTQDFSLRWFQLRILHRILPSNTRLLLYGITETDECERCPGTKETIRHLFLSCPSVEDFWRQFTNTFGISSLSKEAIMMGSSPILESTSLYVMILLAKRYIFHCKLSKAIPSFSGFPNHALKYIVVEKYIARVTDKQDQFKRHWKRYIELLKK